MGLFLYQRRFLDVCLVYLTVSVAKIVRSGEGTVLMEKTVVSLWTGVCGTCEWTAGDGALGYGERTGTEPESDSHCRHGRELTSQGERATEEELRERPPSRKVCKQH